MSKYRKVSVECGGDIKIRNNTTLDTDLVTKFVNYAFSYTKTGINGHKPLLVTVRPEGYKFSYVPNGYKAYGHFDYYSRELHFVLNKDTGVTDALKTLFHEIKHLKDHYSGAKFEYYDLPWSSRPHEKRANAYARYWTNKFLNDGSESCEEFTNIYNKIYYNIRNT